jgi:hypothetical protein
MILTLKEAIGKQMAFCLKVSKYKCGIFVSNQENREIIKNIISGFLPVPNRDVVLREHQDISEVLFKNGSSLKIILLKADNQAKGQRFNGLIIDNIFEEKILRCLVYPTLAPIWKKRDFDKPANRVYYVNISESDNIDKVKLIEERKKKMAEIYATMFSFDTTLPIKEKDLDNTHILLYNAIGLSKDSITCETEFVNKTKQMYLVIKGKYEDKELKYENTLNTRILVNTEVYDSYDFSIVNGILKVTLYEIKNEVPVFKRVWD